MRRLPFASVLLTIVACGTVAKVEEPDSAAPIDDASTPDSGAPDSVTADASASADAPADTSVEADADAGSETVSSVVTGRWQTCFVMSTGRLFCAGLGQLKPTLVPGVNDAVEVAYGGFGNGLAVNSHICIRHKAGTVSCWGKNTVGQLGDGTTEVRTGIVDVVGIANAVQLSGGLDAAMCARLSDGTVKCWGENTYGALGNGTTDNSSTPTLVSGLTDAVEISVGGSGGCARRSGGSVVCWGGNIFGTLGDSRFDHAVCGGLDCSTVPVPVAGIAAAKAISYGTASVYAMKNDGSVWAWGDATGGAMGDGLATHETCSGTDCVSTPTAVGLVAAEIVAARAGACARLSTGGVKCWGNDLGGRLGNGTPLTASNVPVDVFGLTDASKIVGGGYDSVCALRPAGRISCWGRNENGSLAIGSATLQVSSPVDVKW